MADVELNVRKETFRCSSCTGYLFHSPIRILPDGTNICGLCNPGTDVLSYPNIALEEVLKHATFPCNFQNNGCTECLTLSCSLEHEQHCLFKEPKRNDVQTSSDYDIEIISDDESNVEDVSDSSEPTPSTSQIQNEQVIPTPAIKSSNSVCEPELTQGNEAKQETASQAASEYSSASTTRNGDTRRNRPHSTTSFNRPGSHWYRNRRNYSGYNRPYYIDWRHDNLWGQQGNFRQEDVMFKRRNNVIVIKGGTFYVNW